MARFHAITWTEGNFERTASLLSFNRVEARRRYAGVADYRYVEITYTEFRKYAKRGLPHRLVLWDAATPDKFVFSA